MIIRALNDHEDVALAGNCPLKYTYIVALIGPEKLGEIDTRLSPQHCYQVIFQSLIQNFRHLGV